MTWKCGDHALIVKSTVPRFNGLECIIVSPYGRQYTRDGSKYIMGWKVLILAHPDLTYGAGVENLVPIPKGNEKSSWDDCVWKPKVLEVLTCVTK